MGKMKALAQADMEAYVQNLNGDYALYTATIVLNENITMGGIRRTLDPRHYLEDYMEAHTQPPYEVCFGFLLQFMDYDKAAEWANEIAWDEDEEEDKEPQLREDQLECLRSLIREKHDTITGKHEDWDEDEENMWNTLNDLYDTLTDISAYRERHKE